MEYKLTLGEQAFLLNLANGRRYSLKELLDLMDAPDYESWNIETRFLVADLAAKKLDDAGVSNIF